MTTTATRVDLEARITHALWQARLHEAMKATALAEAKRAKVDELLETIPH